jgi:hypothetical protein
VFDHGDGSAAGVGVGEVAGVVAPPFGAGVLAE